MSKVRVERLDAELTRVFRPSSRVLPQLVGQRAEHERAQVRLVVAEPTGGVLEQFDGLGVDLTAGEADALHTESGASKHHRIPAPSSGGGGRGEVAARRCSIAFAPADFGTTEQRPQRELVVGRGRQSKGSLEPDASVFVGQPGEGGFACTAWPTARSVSPTGAAAMKSPCAPGAPDDERHRTDLDEVRVTSRLDGEGSQLAPL